MKKFDQTNRALSLGIILGIGIAALSILLVMTSRVEGARQQFYTLQDQLRLFRTEVWHIEKLDEATLAKEFEGQIKRFAVKDELGSLIQELGHIAERTGVTVDALHPKDSSGVENFSKVGVMSLEKIPIEMQVHGTFGALANFTSSLAHLDLGLIKAERFQIDSKDETAGDLKLVLTGILYLKKSKDDTFFTGGKETLSFEGAKPKPRSRFQDMGRNPFSTATQSEKAGIVVEGVIYDPAAPLAIISGRVHAVGDQINGVKILEIKRGSVVFEKNGVRSEVSIVPET